MQKPCRLTDVGVVTGRLNAQYGWMGVHSKIPFPLTEQDGFSEYL